jgi:hypothetical protein
MVAPEVKRKAEAEYKAQQAQQQILLVAPPVHKHHKMEH